MRFSISQSAGGAADAFDNKAGFGEIALFGDKLLYRASLSSKTTGYRARANRVVFALLRAKGWVTWFAVLVIVFKATGDDGFGDGAQPGQHMGCSNAYQYSTGSGQARDGLAAVKAVPGWSLHSGWFGLHQSVPRSARAGVLGAADQPAPRCTPPARLVFTCAHARLLGLGGVNELGLRGHRLLTGGLRSPSLHPC